MPYIFTCDNLSNNELRQVAKLHEKELNTSFLAQLGADFLFYLYKSINECIETELIIAKENDAVTGFITGAISLKPIYIHLIKNYFFRASFRLLPHLFNISKAKKIIEILSYSKNEEETNTIDTPKAELLSIAVKRKHRGAGIAQQLFLKLSERFKESGHGSFKIIVGENLVAARKFYQKMGASEIGSAILHEGEKSLILKVTL